MGCYSHLSDDEREQIGLAEALGHSIGAIAQAIGRPKSTVWRELCRNRLPSGRYSPLHAAGAYNNRIDPTRWLWSLQTDDYSVPMQSSARLARLDSAAACGCCPHRGGYGSAI